MSKIRFLASIMPIFILISCVPQQPDTDQIRPMIKYFLICMSRNDVDQCSHRVSYSFLSHTGGGTYLRQLMESYSQFLKPNLFEMDVPHLNDGAYVTRVYLHDGKGLVLTADVWMVYSDPYWKVDSIEWYEPHPEH